MQTNKFIDTESELGQAAKKLVEAGYDYWKLYQKQLGSCAVVWLEMENGHFILFTRGEYKNAILDAAGRECRHEIKLFKPFSS